MSDESLTNAAVEWLRAVSLSLNLMERNEFTPAVTDDFVLDDRRSGFNYGLLDVSGFRELLRSTWDVGSGRPSWSMPEVIAVRGLRIAAVTFVNDFGNDIYTEMIACFRLHPQLQLLHRLVQFDIDARDAAIAEVDRMHAEIEAGDA